MHIVTRAVLKKIYGTRKPWSRKGDFGSLLIVGGSRLYTGSLALNALAALRSGCDLVTIAAPQRAADIAARVAPDIIAYPLKGDCLAPAHVKELNTLKEGKDALVIGGGLGRKKESGDMVNIFLQKLTMPAVVDADAIHGVAKNKSVIKNNFVLTPHPGEFFALTGKKAGNEVKQRMHAVKKSAAELGCVILLKGHVDVISDGTRTAINKTGSPYMTKGGTGDTLAGICGALLCRTDPFTAACAAAYVNGRAGQLAAGKKESLLASDVVERIPDVIS